MKSIESCAKTMDEAVALGLEKLGVSVADVDIEVLDSGNKGLFGFLGAKPVVVRLTVKEEEEEDVLSSIALNQEQVASQAPAEEKNADTEKAVRQEKKAQAPKTEKTAKKEKSVKSEKSDKTPKQPAAKETAKETAAVVQHDPKSEATPADEEAQKRTAEFLQELTRLMGVNVEINMHCDEEGSLRVQMFGDELGVLIGRRGETLDALQYLTSLYVNRGREDYVRVTLDSENYRARREESLRRLANRMANRVVKTGKKVKLEPMNPYERRILHSALQANESVTTHSEGEEPNRHVVITLKQKAEVKEA